MEAVSFISNRIRKVSLGCCLVRGQIPLIRIKGNTIRCATYNKHFHGSIFFSKIFFRNSNKATCYEFTINIRQAIVFVGFFTNEYNLCPICQPCSILTKNIRLFQWQVDYIRLCHRGALCHRFGASCVSCDFVSSFLFQFDWLDIQLLCAVIYCIEHFLASLAWSKSDCLCFCECSFFNAECRNTCCQFYFEIQSCSITFCIIIHFKNRSLHSILSILIESYTNRRSLCFCNRDISSADNSIFNLCAYFVRCDFQHLCFSINRSFCQIECRLVHFLGNRKHQDCRFTGIKSFFCCRGCHLISVICGQMNRSRRRLFTRDWGCKFIALNFIFNLRSFSC